MPSREAVANQILAAYGELGFRLAAAAIAGDEAVRTTVTEAAAACDDPADWLGFLSRVRERAALWVETHPEDAPRPSDSAFRSSSPTALDFTVLPVDALSAHEATTRLGDDDRRFLFDVLVGRVPTGDRVGLETRLAQVLQNLRTAVRDANFPAAEDIP